MCESLFYLPPIILPPRRLENRVYLGLAHPPPPRTSHFGWIFAGERFPEPLPGAAAGSAGQLWAAPGSAGRLRVASAGSGELRLTIFSISQGVGGMAEPFKSAAPLSVLRRVKPMCFNILDLIYLILLP